MLNNLLLSGWRTNTGLITLLVTIILQAFGIGDQKIIQLVAEAAIVLAGYGIARKIDTKK
jgi:hypothetical protein